MSYKSRKLKWFVQTGTLAKDTPQGSVEGSTKIEAGPGRKWPSNITKWAGKSTIEAGQETAQCQKVTMTG